VSWLFPFNVYAVEFFVFGCICLGQFAPCVARMSGGCICVIVQRFIDNGSGFNVCQQLFQLLYGLILCWGWWAGPQPPPFYLCCAAQALHHALVGHDVSGKVHHWARFVLEAQRVESLNHLCAVD
jgi:hypothetical protein